MTTISSGVSSSPYSPLDLLQQELSSEVSSGTISSDDQDALSSALNDIDSALQPGQASGSQTYGPPSPDAIKQKVSDLISQEVSNGKLTTDQGTELQNVFNNTFSKATHHGHHAHGGGQPPAASSDDSTSATDTDGTDTSSATQTLQDFMKLIQDLQSSSNNYSPDGSNDGTSNSQLSLVNFLT